MADTPDDAPFQRRLARRIAAVRFDDLPPAAVHWAKVGMLDTVAVTLAGAAEPCTRLVAEAAGAGAVTGSCLMLGTDRRVPAADAVLVNGTAAHALDFDDVNADIGGHPSVMTAPVALALGEAAAVDGRAVLAAYVAGFETACRLGLAVHPRHYDRGWHPTATLGLFGAVATAAQVTGLDEARTATALAVAASLRSGIKANFGTMTKPLHVGHTLRSALLATDLAAAGFEAGGDTFGHPHGWFRVYNAGASFDPERALADWGDPWEVADPGPGLKQHPCCGSTHPAIDCVLDLRSDHGLGADEVAAVEVLTSPLRLPHTDNPDPRAGLEGKFSLHYVVARALAKGRVGLNHFSDAAVAETALRPLMARVSAGPHPEMGEETGNRFGAEVVVTTADGRRLAARVDDRVCRGPSDPMSDAELWAKFTDCAGRALPAPRLQTLYDALMALEDAADIRDVTALMSAPGAAGQAAE